MKTKNLNMRNKNSYWIFTLSAFIAIFIVQNIFEKSNIILRSFSDRTIGIAVLQGIDVASRSLLYVKMIFIFIATFIISHKIFASIWSYSTKIIGTKDLKKDSTVLFTLSIFSIFTLIFHYINGSEVFVGILEIFKIIIFLSLATLIAKLFAKIKKPNLFKLLNNYNLIILSFLFPIVVSFVRWIIISGSFIYTRQHLFFYSLTWIVFWITLYIVFNFIPKKSTEIKIVSVLKSGFILLLIPASTILSNELQYSLSNTISWSETKLSIFAMILLLFTSFATFIFNKSRNLKFNFAKSLYFPIIVGTATLFSLHTNYLSISYLDTFHHGENLISTQQLFSFGTIPFANLYPTHGLSYMFSQILYSLVNGYQPFAPWLWEWIPKIAEIIILYLILARVTNSFFSGLLITFLPIIGIFGGQALVYGYDKSLPTTYYFMPLGIGLILIWSLRNINFKSTFILWISCLLMIAWRVDFGISSLVSAGVILFLSIIKKQIGLSEKIKSFKTVATSLISSLLIAFTTLYALCIVGSVSVYTVISQIFEFVKFQGQAQGLIQVISSYSSISVFQYVILPGIGIFYILHYLLSIFNQSHRKIAEYKILLVYIALFSLIIFIRSFQRQTLSVMGYNPYLFVFLMLALPIYLSKRKSQLSLLIFIISLFIYQLVLPNSAILLKSGQLVTLHTWKSKENRVEVNDYQYKEIVSFINSNLDKDQTFLDLSSSPLLYVASNRKFTNYFIPNAYITSETIQKNSLINVTKASTNNEMPIVIYRQPVDGANFIDGVPNEIRSYKIYEYIYKNYYPVGYIDRYMIWAKNNYLIKDQKNLKKDESIKQEFNFGKLPYIWANYDRLDAKENTKVIEKLVDKPINLGTKSNTNLIYLNKHNNTNGNYIHLKIKSDTGGSFKLILSDTKPTSYITFDLIQSLKPEDYLIRISSLYEWSKNDIKSIRLTSSVNAILTDGYLREGD